MIQTQSHIKQAQWNSYQSLFVLRNFAQQIFFLSFNDLHQGRLKVDLNLSCLEFLQERLKRTSYIKCFCQRSLLLFRNRKMKRRWRTKVSMAHDKSEGRSSLKKEREIQIEQRKFNEGRFSPGSDWICHRVGSSGQRGDRRVPRGQKVVRRRLSAPGLLRCCPLHGHFDRCWLDGRQELHYHRRWQVGTVWEEPTVLHTKPQTLLQLVGCSFDEREGRQVQQRYWRPSCFCAPASLPLFQRKY